MLCKGECYLLNITRKDTFRDAYDLQFQELQKILGKHEYDGVSFP